MANLETLSIQINANATGANEGINGLIGSLRRLSRSVGTATSALTSLNSALKTLRSYGFKLPKMSNTILDDKKISKATEAIKKQAQTAKTYDIANNNGRGAKSPDWAMQAQKAYDERMAKGVPNPSGLTHHEQWYDKNGVPIGTDYEAHKVSPDIVPDEVKAKYGVLTDAITQTANAAPAATNAITETGNAAANTGNTVQTAANQITSSVNNANTAMQNNASATKEAAEEAEESQSAFAKLAEKIGRVAQTMLIRFALKAVIQQFKDAYSAAYNFSKQSGGEFAKNIDSIKSSLASVATNIVRAFSPLMSIVSPALSVVAQGVKYLCNVIVELLSYLGMVSDLFSTTAENIYNVGSSSSSATKNITASFDELNVIDSSSGSSSGSGSSTKISDAIIDQIDAIKMVIAESMLAVGLILAFSGHIAIGTALAAVGAATIVGTVATKYGELSEEVQGQITTIMAIAGGAMLAIGMIFAVTGANLPLGIGLMIAGAANLATSVALSWSLSDDIKKKIGIITAAVGGGLLAIGAILTFTGGNIPLGIGLMVAGAASLAASVAITWGVDQTINEKIQKVTAIVGGAFLALGALLAFTGHLPLGIGLLLVGAVTLATAATTNDTATSELTKTINTITAVVGGAMLAVGALLVFTGAGIPLGLGLMAAGGVSLIAAINPDWGAIGKKIEEAFSSVSEFLTNAWNTVKNAVSSAWNAVRDWWNNSWIGQKVNEVWGGVQTFFKDLWEGSDGNGGIKGWAVNAWNEVSNWWETNVTSEVKKNGVWGGVKGFFKGIFVGADGKSGILGWADSALEGARKWWTTNVKENIEKEGVWGGVKGFFKGLWEGADGKGGVKGYALNAWNTVKYWWEKTWIGQKISGVWSSVKTTLTGVFNSAKTSIMEAWTRVKEWWESTWIGQKISGIWSEVKSTLTGAWNSVKTSVSNAWTKVRDWWETSGLKEKIKDKWNDAKLYLTTAWDGVKKHASDAWNMVEQWWTTSGIGADVEKAWTSAKNFLIDDVWTPIATAASNAWDNISDFFGDIKKLAETAWTGIADWFTENVSEPIEGVFKAAINWCIDKINVVINALNSVGSFTIPGVDGLWDETKITLFSIGTIAPVKAEGDYDIPRGQLFIANEAGAEMVGSMDGHTAVANQQQIVEGIRKGVADGQREQNLLLREQNNLLRGILEKEGNVRIEPSSSLGKVAKRSIAMYNNLYGG